MSSRECCREMITMKMDFSYVAIFLFLSLVQINFAGRCPSPIDRQCARDCYYLEGGECLPCSICRRNSLGDPQYYKSECKTFPNFCGISDYVPPPDYPTDFPPHYLPEQHEVYLDDDGRWLVFFFQERCPVIAKLCMNEYRKSQEEWFSFQKTCLNITGSDGTRYNGLEDVKNHSYDVSQKPMYFAAASGTDDSGNSKSAVIWLDVTVLIKVFQSNQYLADPESDFRYPVAKVPSNGVIHGYCPHNNRLTDQQKTFLREHPFMFDNVNVTSGITSNGSGFLFEGWGNYTALETMEKKAHDGLYYKTAFIGTEDGRLLKVVLNGKMTSSAFVEENYLTKNSTIGIVSVRSFEVFEAASGDPRVRKLNVTTTDGNSRNVSVYSQCGSVAILNTRCLCEQDPFCYWTGGSCKPFQWNVAFGSGGSPTHKIQCDVSDLLEGYSPDRALTVVDPYGRVVFPTTPGYGSVNSSRGLPPRVGQSSEEDVVQGSHSNRPGPVALITMTMVGVIGIIGGLALWVRSKSPYRQVPKEDDFEMTWTSITCKQLVVETGRAPPWPFFGNCHVNERDIWIVDENNERIYGETRNRKFTFQNLKPLTTYDIQIASHDKLIRCKTSGPQFTNHRTGKDTYSVDVADWDQGGEIAFIILRNDRGFSREKALDGTTFQMSGLPPNMSCDVYLAVKREETLIETLIKKIETHPEEFTISLETMQLSWSNLSKCVERLSISCCQCVFKEPKLVELPETDDHVDLPTLPCGVMCTFTIKGKFTNVDFEHVIGTVEYATPKMVVKKKLTAATVDVDEGILYHELRRDEALASTSTGISKDSGISGTSTPIVLKRDGALAFTSTSISGDSVIRSAPTPIELPDSCLSIPMDDLSHITTYMQRSQSMEEKKDQRLMFGNRNNYFENNHININIAAPSTDSYRSQISMPSSSSILPLRSSDSFIQIENGESTFHSCSKTLANILELTVTQKKVLTMKLYLTPTVVKIICELLGYNETEIQVYSQGINLQTVEALQPLKDKDTQLGEVSLSFLLLKLVGYLQAIVADENSEKYVDKCHWIIQNLSSMVHGDAGCTLCEEICRTGNHLAECRS